MGSAAGQASATGELMGGMKRLFEYFDYRAYLKDYYEEKKKANRNFSHRYIASKVGFDSGYFTKIIQGTRHISVPMAEKFAAFLHLNFKEAEYFKTLVLFGKAETHSEKKALVEKLLTFQNSKVQTIAVSQYQVFDTWYYLAVREALDCFEFKGDYEELARRIDPPITEAQARKAVQILEKVGFIKKSGKGFVKTEPLLRTEKNLATIGVEKFQQTMLELNKEAFDRIPNRNRDFSTLTLSVGEDEFRSIVRDLANLRSRFLEMANSCTKPERVLQCNFMVFPLTRLDPKEEKP